MIRKLLIILLGFLAGPFMIVGCVTVVGPLAGPLPNRSFSVGSWSITINIDSTFNVTVLQNLD